MTLKQHKGDIALKLSNKLGIPLIHQPHDWTVMCNRCEEINFNYLVCALYASPMSSTEILDTLYLEYNYRCSVRQIQRLVQKYSKSFGFDGSRDQKQSFTLAIKKGRVGWVRDPLPPKQGEVVRES